MWVAGPTATGRWEYMVRWRLPAPMVALSTTAIVGHIASIRLARFATELKVHGLSYAKAGPS